MKEEDIYDIFSVELTKKPGRGLGLSIVGKRNDVGVYISDIVSTLSLGGGTILWSSTSIHLTQCVSIRV